MIDFTNSIEELNNYKGSEKKKTLVYNGKKYLVKFPDPIREKNKNISYIKNAFSEYIGSNTFKLCGFEVQNTILGLYYYNNKEKIVCACEDFTDESHVLYEFENLVLSSNLDKKIETEIDDIIEVITNSKNVIDSEDTILRFWDMFVIDALIGNTDRHNGNWGFIKDKTKSSVSFAPIFDCGSCLNPTLSDDEVDMISDSEIKNLAINCYSCLKENNKRINYMSYIKQMKNDNCNKAIMRVFNSINLELIISFISEIECLPIQRKEFYTSIINKRYDILKSVYEILSK